MDMTLSTLPEDALLTPHMAAPLELAIVLPTFNERDNLAPLMDRIADALGPVGGEVLVVDDNSASHYRTRASA